jgi:zinc protease
LLAEIDVLIKDGVTEEELQKVKNKKLLNFYRAQETINGKAAHLGEYEVFFGDYKKVFDAPAEYNKVSAADIKTVAAKYFTKSQRTVGVLAAKEE